MTRSRGLVQLQLQNDSVALDKYLAFFGHIKPSGGQGGRCWKRGCRATFRTGTQTFISLAEAEGRFWASLEPQLTGRFGNKGEAKGLSGRDWDARAQAEPWGHAEIQGKWVPRLLRFWWPKSCGKQSPGLQPRTGDPPAARWPPPAPRSYLASASAPSSAWTAAAGAAQHP